MTEYIHTSVLLHESIDNLNLRKGGVYVDGTLGSGGHLIEALNHIGDSGLALGIDQDEAALARTTERLAVLKKKALLVKNSYRNVAKVLDEHAHQLPQGEAKMDAFMLDLGLSSDQFETSGRGFTFRKDEPLLMTFNAVPNEETLTAREIVNVWDENNIADVIYGYGEEKFSRKIAKGIVDARAIKPIETTFELVDIIKKSTPGWYHHGKIHPATRTFQALRITVNDEIGALTEGLAQGFERLRKGGRMAVISFHSIEDRVVKRFMRHQSDAGLGQLITKKPLPPQDAELIRNPRARSAKLRVIEKIM